MREIKFRAWNTRFNVMYDWQVILDSLKLERMLEGHPEVKLMQYTGLKDSKGQEIYEGDIVKKRAHDKARQVIWNTQRGRYYLHPLGKDSQSEVDVDEFNSASSMAPHWFTQGFYNSYEEDCAVEVVGNRFEHPHLLNPTEQENK